MGVRDKIRKLMRAEREKLSKKDQQTVAEKITQKLIESEIFQTSQRIACYIQYQAEVDTHRIIRAIGDADKICYLPVLTGKHLSFVEYAFGDTLKENKFGILEPILSPSRMAALNDLDLVLTPLVAFDRQQHRLGTGAGFYDRTFEQSGSRPTLCGLAYSFQEVDLVPNEHWDVPLDFVITEEEVIYKF
ncbi:MAG: 5-formyltetrahydrofolate cyclo-ligase [Pseudomonadota bacterium]